MNSWGWNGLRFLTVVLLCLRTEPVFAGTYRIAGVFSAETGQVEEELFTMAVDRVNTDKKDFPNVQLQAVVIKLKDGESWKNYVELCEELEKGAVAIVGAESATEDSLISSVSSALHIPHLRTGFNRKLQDPDEVSLSLAPSPSDLAEVVRALILHMEWTQIVYIYDTSTGLLRMNELEEDEDFKGRRLFPIDLSVDSNPWDNIVKLGIRKVVVDIESKSVEEVLKEISRSGLSHEQYTFILPTTDLRIPADNTQFLIDANVYTFSLVNPSNGEMNWIYRKLQGHSDDHEPNLPFIYDAVLQVGATLSNLTDLQLPIRSNRVSCDSRQHFADGRRLYDAVRGMNSMEGVTGFVEFDDRGARRVKHVHVKVLEEGKLNKVADWRLEDGLKFFKEMDPKGEPDEALEQDQGLKKKIYIVSSIAIEPFLKRNFSSHLKGNERYSGFVKDLLDRLSTLLKFDFFIKEVDDGFYGRKNETTKHYNGIIGELIDGKADFAVAPLTINAERYEVIDFTLPFLEASLGLLASREHDTVSHSFLSPFTPAMWVTMFFTMIFATLVITFIARLSPREWSHVSETVIETKFTVGNCFWYLFSTIMFQRFQLKPCSPAVIVAFFIWFIFCLAVMVSYGTVLGEFIIKYNEKPIIGKIDDLLKGGEKVKFSMMSGGSTQKFFEETRYPKYMDLYQKMDKEGMVTSVAGSLARIKKEDFALFAESPTIEYHVSIDCELQQVEGTVGSLSYGIATAKSSLLTKYLSAGVLSLRRDGTLQMLRSRWWSEYTSGKHCPNHNNIVRPTPFTVRFGRLNMLFVFLLGGIILSVALTIYNYVRKQMSIDDKNEFRYFIPTLWKEIQTVIPRLRKEPANPSPGPDEVLPHP